MCLPVPEAECCWSTVWGSASIWPWTSLLTHRSSATYVVSHASQGLVLASQGCQREMCLVAICLPLDLSAIVCLLAGKQLSLALPWYTQEIAPLFWADAFTGYWLPAVHANTMWLPNLGPSSNKTQLAGSDLCAYRTCRLAGLRQSFGLHGESREPGWTCWCW